MTWFESVWRRRFPGVSAGVLAALLLAGCSPGFSYFPPSSEPVRTDAAEWRNHQFQQISLVRMPREIASAIPDRHGPGAARFLIRTLETAPDGDMRRWQSMDQTVIFDVQPNSTTVTGGTICRGAVLRIKTAQEDRSFDLRICRQKNGMWAR